MDQVKKRFRSKLKQETVDYLKRQKSAIHYKIQDNKNSLKKISFEQNILKKEFNELNRMIAEYLK